MPEPFVVAFVAGVTPGKWLRIWNERMPGSPIEARPDADPLPALASGSADVALVRLPIDRDGLSVIPLYEETAVVVAPKDHPIAAYESVVLADLEGETMLAGEGTDAVELVAANVGIAIMPQAVARAHSRRDVVARPVTDAPATSIALVWVADRTTPLVDEFVGIVRGRTANSSRSSRVERVETSPSGSSSVKSRQARSAKGAKGAKRRKR